MRRFAWFFRPWRARAGVAVCQHCDLQVQVCGACRGAWQGTGCGCGVGGVCPGCGPHWV